MAKITPFRGLRFQTKKAGAIESLVCPPYDIVSDREREALISRNEFNAIRLELPQGENRYGQAAQLLESWKASGVLERDAQPGYYLYEEEFQAYGDSYRLRGFICTVELEEFSKGVVLPHEETLSKAKEDRFQLMKHTFCNFSQIYSLYDDPDGSIFALVQELSRREPDQTLTTEDGITHRLWHVTQPDALAALSAKFEGKQLFIADGHHRYETALRFRDYLRAEGVIQSEDHPANRVMMMLVDLENPGLVVFPTHRMVRDLKNFTKEQVLQGAEKYFTVEHRTGAASCEEALRGQEHAVAFYAGGTDWYLLTLKDMGAVQRFLPEKDASYCELDVAVLHTLILEQVLGIDRENMAKQINLTYTRSAQEAIGQVESGAFQCSFLLNPTKVSQIRNVALAGEKMPQKSTYFYPKILTGLVFNPLGGEEA